MRISSGGSQDINLLQSDAAQFRNEDFAVNNNLSFQDSTALSGAASDYAHIGMFNPAASGITILIDGMIMSTTVASPMYLSHISTELTTFLNVWVNRHLGQAVGAGRLSNQNNTSILGAVLTHVNVSADNYVKFEFRFPFELDEGEGLVAVHGTVNSGLLATFWGREV